MATFLIKQGSLEPAITRQLLDYDGVTPIDLTTADSVGFRWVDPDGIAVAEKVATIVTALTGNVAYQWASGDTAKLGRCRGEFVINWPGGRPQAVPASGFVDFEITKPAT